MSSVSGARVFLSASIPLPTRNPVYFGTADVLAIRDAVRALAIAVVEEEAELVFGGHPAITPMIRLQLMQAGATRVGDRFVLFQSRHFPSGFARDNTSFERVELVDDVPNDREASLLRLREAMLADPFDVGVFIGGMEGVEDEYELFRQMQPAAQAFPVASTGAAAAAIFDRDPDLQREHPELRAEISYLESDARNCPGRADASLRSCHTEHIEGGWPAGQDRERGRLSSVRSRGRKRRTSSISGSA